MNVEQILLHKLLGKLASITDKLAKNLCEKQRKSLLENNLKFTTNEIAKEMKFHKKIKINFTTNESSPVTSICAMLTPTWNELF